MKILVHEGKAEGIYSYHTLDDLMTRKDAKVVETAREYHAWQMPNGVKIHYLASGGLALVELEGDEKSVKDIRNMLNSKYQSFVRNKTAGFTCTASFEGGMSMMPFSGEF